MKLSDTRRQEMVMAAEVLIDFSRTVSTIDPVNEADPFIKIAEAAVADAIRGHGDARSSDPQTSTDAAASVSFRKGSQLFKLLAEFHEAGVRGPTDDQAAMNCGLTRKPRCCWWKRCSELRSMGLIESIAGVTRPTSVGEQAMVCRVTKAGEYRYEQLRA